MLRYQDFVPKMTNPPGFLAPAEYESFDAAVAAADRWMQDNRIHPIQVETVVLPNIFSRYEEGTRDASLGTSGESPSFWHQIVRVWYDSPNAG